LLIGRVLRTRAKKQARIGHARDGLSLRSWLGPARPR
jgi:hypothetical protein